MALMFPSVMLVLNLSSIAVLWFGGHLVADGSMQIGALTAFLSYLLQILMSVMMATFMFMMVPAGRGLRGADPRGRSTPSPTWPARPRPVTHAGRRTARLELRDAEFRYPGAEQPVLCDISLVAAPGQVTADHRRHRQRQDDAGQPHPAADGRDRRRGPGRRRRRPRAGPGGAVGR